MQVVQVDCAGKGYTRSFLQWMRMRGMLEVVEAEVAVVPMMLCDGDGREYVVVVVHPRSDGRE